MFFVIETQVNGNTGAICPVITRETRNEAEASYHTILAAAAVSNVDVHGAIILSEDCIPVMYKSYDHREVAD